MDRVAEEQQQWPQAREYFITALQTYVGYSGDATLPTAVATVLGISPAETAALLAQAAGDAD